MRRALFSLALIILVGLTLLWLFASPSSPQRRNQRTAYALLRAARANPTGCCITSVSLGRALSLAPDHPMTVNGYTFTLRVTGLHYQVVAKPAIPKRSGFLTYTTDETRSIRSQYIDPPPVELSNPASRNPTQ